jgi:hypothetical protein
MARFLHVVPMMELSKKSLYQIKHLVRPFPEKAVRMIDHDHKTGVPISESDQVIQESDPWAQPPLPAVRGMLKLQCSTERVGDSYRCAPPSR